MAEMDCMSRLGGWEGYGVTGWRHERRAGQRWLVIELEPQAGGERICSGCGEAVVSIHDRRVRAIRDLPVFEDPVELSVVRLRLACPRCGPRLQQLDWLEPHARVTRRLARSVARLCTVACAPPISVITQPGCRASTTIPRGASARASWTVSMFCAALLAL